jgi:Tfp pilus assembly protein PilF
MRRLALILALLFALTLSFLSPCAFAQSAPLGRTEILGRLALSYSPSYVASLVKKSGISFTASTDFLEQVKSAGGDGILIERLSAADATSSAATSGEADKPIEHLAKCAELLHTGAAESAEAECRAAIDESPRSPWPLLISAQFLPFDPFVGDEPSESDKAKIAKRVALLARAAALAPDLQAVHFYQGDHVPISNGSADSQRDYWREDQQLEIAEGRDNNYDALDFLEIDEGRSQASTGEVEAEPFTVNPEFLRRAELEPELASNRMNLALQYASAHDIERAKSELQEAIRLEPDSPAPHVQLAVLYFRAHASDAGVAELRAAARSIPYGVRLHVALSDALEFSGHASDAIGELQNLVSVHAADAVACDALVRLYLKHKDQKSAIEEIRRSLQASSLAYTDELEFVNARYQDEHQLAYLLFEDRQFEAATEQYRYLLRLKPDDAGLHNDFGNVLLAQHDADAATDEYYAAIRLDPEMSAAHNNIGLCLAQKNNLDGAISEFRRALDINPNEAHTEVFLGAALGQKGDLKGAKEQFQDAIQKNPKDVDAQVGVAFALAQLKDEAGAIAHLKTALELQPDSPGAENNLAWMYCTAVDTKLRNPSEALVLARHAVATSPSPNPAFLDTLAEAQLLNGLRSEALATETQAVKLDPSNPEYQTRLARFREAASTAKSSQP